MTSADLIALSPLIALAGLSIVTMLGIAVHRGHAVTAGLSVLACVLTFATLPWAAGVAPRAVTTLLIIDRYALLYMGLFLAATIAVIAWSYGYLAVHVEDLEEREEFYLLLLLGTLGALVLSASAHLVSFFLGIELIGVSLYSLIGYLRARRAPLEAAMKYLLLSGSASAFLLFGMALLYFDAGGMSFRDLGAGSFGRGAGPLRTAGVVLILVGVGFKIGLVPFHLWMPDVYQGAPAPVTAYVATVSKGAVFALLLRFVTDLQVGQSAALGHLLALLAAGSMIAGNLLALLQTNVKRLLAYSSIAHFGYALVALLAGGPVAAEAVTFYLTAYFVMTLAAFGVVTLQSDGQRDADEFEDYRGLFWSRPWLAAAFMLALLSLAGIPVTVGFVGKFYAIAAGVDAGLWLLVFLLVANSAVGVYYYLRLIVILFEQPAPVRGPLLVTVNPAAWTAALSLGLVVSLLLWLGGYPQPFIEVIRDAVTGVGTMVGVSRLAPPP
ncbi:MAG TPA: NADH-quinone oxidoreductase subunit N [Nitrospira sp.]|nr:NADH-quinone oxidoreductase subunit N [Nitrospira sp.]